MLKIAFQDQDRCPQQLDQLSSCVSVNLCSCAKGSTGVTDVDSSSGCAGYSITVLLMNLHSREEARMSAKVPRSFCESRKVSRGISDKEAVRHLFF